MGKAKARPKPNSAAWRNRIIGSAMVLASELLANPANWRVHPKAQQDALAGALGDIGWIQEVIVNQQTGHVVDGHLRVSLALRQGDETPVPVKYVDLSEAEEKLALATIDPLSAMAVADKEQLDALLREVNTDSAALQAMLAETAQAAGLAYGAQEEADAEPQIDRAEELRVKWGVETGQLWRVGEHRIVCGESQAHIVRMTEGLEVAAVITDPPYGINIVRGLSPADSGGAKPFGRVRPADGRARRGVMGKVGVPCVVEPRLYRPVRNDDKPFDPAWLLPLAKKVILFGANHYASRLPDSPAWLVWENGVSDQATFSACELLWTNVGNHVKRYEWRWSGMVRAGERDVEMQDRIHPTQKPVGLLEQIIADFTAEGDVVLDPYLGSGTTMLASARKNRICVGGEEDEGYVAVTLERMATAFPHLKIERVDD